MGLTIFENTLPTIGLTQTNMATLMALKNVINSRMLVIHRVLFFIGIPPSHLRTRLVRRLMGLI